MSMFYAGIGSRQTPIDVQLQMTQVAIKLYRLGWTLRSGAASGADTAFERGAGDQKEIYLPWMRFNNHPSPLYHPSAAAFEMAEKYHPAWNRCSDASRMLHARNCHQVLGRNLDSPVRFILCWHQGTGGTLQAVRIAEALNIPVFNMVDTVIRVRLDAFLQQG